MQLKNRRKRPKIDSPNTQIHDHSLSWLGTGTSVKSGSTILGVFKAVADLHVHQDPEACTVKGAICNQQQ